MNKKGFTLMELLAIIVLIGVIALIAVPNITKQVKRNEEQKQTLNQKKITYAAKMYVAKYYADAVVGSTTDIKFTLQDLEDDGLLTINRELCTDEDINKDNDSNKAYIKYDRGTERVKGDNFSPSCYTNGNISNSGSGSSSGTNSGSGSSSGTNSGSGSSSGTNSGSGSSTCGNNSKAYNVFKFVDAGNFSNKIKCSETTFKDTKGYALYFGERIVYDKSQNKYVSSSDANIQMVQGKCNCFLNSSGKYCDKNSYTDTTSDHAWSYTIILYYDRTSCTNKSNTNVRRLCTGGTWDNYKNGYINMHGVKLYRDDSSAKGDIITIKDGWYYAADKAEKSWIADRNINNMNTVCDKVCSKE